VYKHHQGSSSSRSSRGYTWIEEIRKAWGVHKDDIFCAAAGCSHNTFVHNIQFDGCHLAESRLKEALSIVGIGGTPVVAMCNQCHSKNGAAILIGSQAIGIIDRDCPADVSAPTTEIDFDSHILCKSCETHDTRGPDEDGDWYCATCDHIMNSDGVCDTDNCCEDGEPWEEPPYCAFCESNSNVEGPDNDGDYWCTYCDNEWGSRNFFQ